MYKTISFLKYFNKTFYKNNLIRKKLFFLSTTSLVGFMLYKNFFKFKADEIAKYKSINLESIKNKYEINSNENEIYELLKNKDKKVTF